MKKSYLLFLLFLVLFASCISNKKLVYLQNKTLAIDDTTKRDYARTKYKIQINDILSINVNTIDQQAVELFNKTGGTQQMMQQGGSAAGDVFYLTGTSVDDSGRVELPMIGKVQVAGSTLGEAKILIEEAAKQYFNNFYVEVKFGGIRYSVLGEVLRPGKFVILQQQLNIFEAIANSGDLTIVANRSEVQIIRQFPDGPQVYSVDLTDRNILYSPNYFIQPNDIIYVKPLKVKSLGTGTTGFGSFQSVIAILSAAILIYTITK
ncbi:MAG: polysaccharide biosynthesis/export family protein [Bacteroidota bacterium]